MRGFAVYVAVVVASVVCGADARAPIEVPALQGGSISGHVRDVSGAPLPGVSVLALPATGGTITRATTGPDGRYQIDGLSMGTYRVDFDLAGFDRVRRNRIAIERGAAATADATLPISSICECVLYVPSVPVRPRSGVVLDTSGRPLPHARLELVAADRREVAYADASGRFEVLLPSDPPWPLIVSDTGFRDRKLQASRAHVTPMALRLDAGDLQRVAETERFELGCLCAALFTHRGR
jgi:hypothetical protein